MDENSRRFAVFEPSGKLMGEHSYFLTFKHHYWASVGNRRATLNYLLNEHRIPPAWHPEASYQRSTLKRKIEAASLNSLSCYLYSLSTTIVAQLGEKHQHHDYLDVQSTELKRGFHTWLTLNPWVNEKPLNRNAFPMELSKLGVFNTQDLPPGPDKKWHRGGQWYRLPLLSFAAKADEYELEKFDLNVLPNLAVEGKFITKSKLGDSLQENLPLTRRKTKTKATTTPSEKDVTAAACDSDKETAGPWNLHKSVVADSDHSQDSADWLSFMQEFSKSYRQFKKEIKREILADVDAVIEMKSELLPKALNFPVINQTTINNNFGMTCASLLYPNSQMPLNKNEMSYKKPSHELLESKSKAQKKVKNFVE